MRCARPRITSATCPTSPLRRTCSRWPSIFSTARPASLSPRPSGTATRRPCWRIWRPSRPAPFQSAGRPLPRRTGWSISWRHCAAASPRTPKAPQRAREPRQPRRANGRECHSPPRRNAAACRQPGRHRGSGAGSPARGVLQHRRPLDARRHRGHRTRGAISWRGRARESSPEPTPMATLSYGGIFAEVRAGKIDSVLVYKVARLTRSLADFAKLIELFDAHGVSFVSVTQSFNTSSSMGRLTLNVLLSFAQFERELIGERVRDKIAASKRKGLWVGGPVPLGYTAVDKKILVVAAEAEAVRTIFARYLELGSVRALAQDLDRRGIRSKPRRRSTGRTVGGGRFGVGALAYLLKNRFYIGELVYRGEVHHGEHEPIVDSALFEAVGAKLAAQAVERRCRLRRLFDHRGNRMSPTHANKRGARYRYYVSQAVL